MSRGRVAAAFGSALTKGRQTKGDAMKNRLISGVILALVLVCAQAICALEQREIRLKVVHAETGKPIEGVALHYTLNEKDFVKVDLDEKAEFRLDLKDAKQARFEINKEGFVNDSVTFG